MAQPGNVSPGPGRAATLTSRLRRADGPRHPWRVDSRATVDLPVILDLVVADQASGQPLCRTQATVDLRDGVPALVRVVMESPGGIDLVWAQREFRWSGPLEVITRLVPQMIRDGRDPFAAEFPVAGLPAVTRPAAHRRLPQEFLEDIAREYLILGPGYARTLAITHQVSPRTVVSWVEKARIRGILSPAHPGRHGGQMNATKPGETP